MALRLRIVSEHRRQLGDRSNIVFGTGGGTIGRSAGNDWVLPDPLRYVSAHHARIEFRQGHYYLEDLSTNGVFVNDDEQPLAKRGAKHRLQHGDVLRFGEYQVVVTLDSDAPARVESSGAGPVPTSIQELVSVGRVSQTDLGASLNLAELLIPDSSPSDRFAPVNAYGQAVAVAPRAPAPAVDEEPDEEVIARRIARLARAAGKDPRNPGASLPALYDVQSGLQAFCRGAGIDADQLPADAQTRLMHLAGQLLREALLGLKVLERTRNEIRNRFRIDPPEDPDDPRPSVARSAIDDLLLQLFKQHESRRLDSVQWLREVMETGKAHETATAKAVREAFVDFVERLNPAELEARFDRAARRSKLLADDARAQYWDLYSDFYRNLAEMPADHLPHTFVEAFANAYRQAITKEED